MGGGLNAAFCAAVKNKRPVTKGPSSCRDSLLPLECQFSQTQYIVKKNLHVFFLVSGSCRYGCAPITMAYCWNSLVQQRYYYAVSSGGFTCERQRSQRRERGDRRLSPHLWLLQGLPSAPRDARSNRSDSWTFVVRSRIGETTDSRWSFGPRGFVHQGGRARNGRWAQRKAAGTARPR